MNLPGKPRGWEIPAEVALIAALAGLTFIARAGMDLVLIAGIAGVAFWAGRRTRPRP